VGSRLDEAVAQQLITVPPQRTSEKGVVVSVDTTTGEVTYTVDGVEHTALVVSGFMPVAGQPVQVQVNGNDRIVMPPAGVDPSLYGPIQAGEGPPVNPNTLVDAVNTVGFDASFGVTTWQFDTTIESWAATSGGVTLAWTGTTGQNEGGGGGIVGSTRLTTTRSGSVFAYSPIVTVLRDPDLASLASIWIKAGAAGSEVRYARLAIQWYNAAGTTFLMETLGPEVHDLNAGEWVSLDVSGFGPANPADNKARIIVYVYNVTFAELFYLDNGILMAPTNSTLSLNAPLPTVLDNFNRADAANMSTGAPLVWTDRSGDWQIVSNQARYVSGGGGLTGTSSGTTTSLDSGIYSNRGNVVIECTVGSSTADTDAWGLIYRYSATNAFWRILTTTPFVSIVVEKVVAGVSTSVLTLSSSILEVGDVVRVELDGPHHRFYVNGAYLGSFSDAHNQTATEHGLYQHSTTTSVRRWDDFSLAPIDKAYTRPGRTSSMSIKSLAAGATFARTPADLVIANLPAVRKDEYWIVEAYCKQRRTNGTEPKPYLFAVTTYDQNGVFLANDFGGGFGPAGAAASAWEWQYMVSAFQIRNPAAARARVNLVMLASAADQQMYISELFVRKASVVTAPIIRTDDDGPRLTTLPTPTGPQIRVHKGTKDDGYSQMLHGYVSGYVTATTDANGYITFSHGLRNGQAPAAVFVQPRSPITGANIADTWIVDSIQTDGTARVRFMIASGGVLAGANAVSYTFYFLTLAAL
jgi:hypothetical protein